MIWHLAIHLHRISEDIVSHDDSLPAYPKCVRHARNKEDYSDVRISKRIVEGIQAPVAEPVRNRKGVIVEHLHEACNVALG